MRRYVTGRRAFRIITWHLLALIVAHIELRRTVTANGFDSQTFPAAGCWSFSYADAAGGIMRHGIQQFRAAGKSG
ncbi:hypothetical protein KCP69_05815 [Salmonella enterica subsp. enterica]|nr:hypothetical protein KCP69_05815 [Salmonella enterica subsp. enterica]